MTSPQIKILLSLGGVSIIYAFVCNIRLSGKAAKLAGWLEKERPELWSKVHVVARNWNGGHPGLKLLHKGKSVDIPRFNQEYGQLASLERQIILGTVVGSVCIGLVILGVGYWGWHW